MNYYDYTIKCCKRIIEINDLVERAIQIAYVKGLIKGGVILEKLSPETAEECNRLLNNLL